VIGDFTADKTWLDSIVNLYTQKTIDLRKSFRSNPLLFRHRTNSLQNIILVKTCLGNTLLFFLEIKVFL